MGEYVVSGEQYNGKPVYQRDMTLCVKAFNIFKKKACRTQMLSLYMRANGKWVLDFDAVSEAWTGTIGYARYPSATPMSAKWNRNMAVGAVAVAIVGKPAYWNFGSRGVYQPNKQLIFSGAPVYQRTHKIWGRSLTWSLYRRDNGKWYLDYNEVSDAWTGTVAYAHTATTTPFVPKWRTASVGSMGVVDLSKPGLQQSKRALQEADNGVPMDLAEYEGAIADEPEANTAVDDLPLAEPEYIEDELSEGAIPEGELMELEDVPDEDDGAETEEIELPEGEEALEIHTVVKPTAEEDGEDW